MDGSAKDKAKPDMVETKIYEMLDSSRDRNGNMHPFQQSDNYASATEVIIALFTTVNFSNQLFDSAFDCFW